MARQRKHGQLNTAGLEADVMRFMAIIAFCLIAIMALVKDVETPPDQEPQIVETPQLAPAPELKPETVPETPAKNQKDASTEALNQILGDILEKSFSPAEASPVSNNPDKTPTQDKEIQQLVQFEKTATDREPNKEKNEIEQTTADISNQLTETESVNTLEPTVVEDNSQQDPETLTFRFDSDATFLHLIATNNLKLFASTSNGYLEMDPTFNVTSAKPSGELFEIMRQSIPTDISSRFEKKSRSPVYLVALSSTTRQDLNTFLESPDLINKTGVLVIHQDGRISHEI